MIEDVKGIHEMALINQALPALESTINSVLHINNLVIQNVVDIDHGKVTSSLFPVKDSQSFNETRNDRQQKAYWLMTRLPVGVP